MTILFCHLASNRSSKLLGRHVPAGMRPLDAVRAGYDEVTHINFLMMQAMPQAIVDKANTAARIEGPAKYGKDVDLGSPALQALQKIRDEAHRFAITYHKKLRQRRTIASVLASDHADSRFQSA